MTQQVEPNVPVRLIALRRGEETVEARTFAEANAALQTLGPGKIDYRVEFENGGLYTGIIDPAKEADLGAPIRAWCKWYEGDPDCPWCVELERKALGVPVTELLE